MLKNNIIKQVEKEFEERQAEIKRQEKQAFLSNMLISDFATLESEIRALTLELIKSETTEEQNKIQKLIDEKTSKQNLLKTNTAINFNCEKCGDTGLINGDYCNCFKKRVSALLVEKSGVNKENLKHFKDSDFFKFENSEETKKVYELFEKLLENLETTKYKNVLIQGDSGIGKTFLLSCITGESIDKGYFTYFTTAFNLNQLMLKYHISKDETRTTLLDPVLESDVLVIDDLGTEQVLKNVTLEYLLEILKTRILNGKHTFISTNLSLDGLMDRYGERIFSRILDKSNSLAIKLNGKNLRLKK